MGSNYGDWLRDRRAAAGLTQQELAEAAIMTRSHIAHIEAGRRAPSRDGARRLDRALTAGNARGIAAAECGLTAGSFEAARRLAQRATAIREFAVSLIPGFLQTERYARAVLRAVLSPGREEEYERIVVTRLERAKILADPLTPAVWALLDEAVLRRVVGGPEVMAEQLRHVVRLAEDGRVRVHILPAGVGAHPLRQSMLSLMWFADRPPIAYMEGIRVARIHADPSVVRALQCAYDLALGDALPLPESLTLLRSTARAYGAP